MEGDATRKTTRKTTTRKTMEKSKTTGKRKSTGRGSRREEGVDGEATRRRYWIGFI
jgi:hypothetical protein